MLHNRKPEPSAPVGSAACVVDAVEALEDSVELSRRNADAIVGDCDLDIVVVASGLHMRRHDDACTRVGIDHGILNQVADRDTNLSSAAQHPGSGNSRHGEGDPLSFRVHPAPLDGVGQHLIDVDDLWMNQRVVSLESRQAR